jgi:hypothetical protein
LYQSLKKISFKLSIKDDIITNKALQLKSILIDHEKGPSHSIMAKIIRLLSANGDRHGAVNYKGIELGREK